MAEEPSLSAILEGIWADLNRAIAEPGHGFRLPGLATVAPDGSPRVRTVVLRACDAAQRRLDLHTDARSSKVRELSTCPQAEMLFYDHPSETQLRARGIVALQRDNAAARTAFESTRLSSRRGYLAMLAPGADLRSPASGLPAAVEARLPTEAEAEEGYAVFCLASLTVTHLDWVRLHRTGHRRAAFAWDNHTETFQGRWLVP